MISSTSLSKRCTTLGAVPARGPEADYWLLLDPWWNAFGGSLDADDIRGLFA